jgi:glycine/D-amino acid oxidase-like deaminating enzyme
MIGFRTRCARTVRALICGAGIAGLTLARQLSRMGWDVAWQRVHLRCDGYLIDFFGPGSDTAARRRPLRHGALGSPPHRSIPAQRDIEMRATGAGWRGAAARQPQDPVGGSSPDTGHRPG